MPPFVVASVIDFCLQVKDPPCWWGGANSMEDALWLCLREVGAFGCGLRLFGVLLLMRIGSASFVALATPLCEHLVVAAAYVAGGSHFVLSVAPSTERLCC
mmetsp:Transcript_19966/g.42196  ORF Transcript_19966/g.42196 Transcript_19966/m.42196 type:complete len:101 (-) Transcript_19966:138-440(-)